MTHDQYTAEREASQRRATTLLDAAKAEYDSWFRSLTTKPAGYGKPKRKPGAAPRKRPRRYCSTPGCHGKPNFKGGLCIPCARKARGEPGRLVPCACGCGRHAYASKAERNGGMTASCFSRFRVAERARIKRERKAAKARAA